MAHELGRVQFGILKALMDVGPYPGGWVWDKPSYTQKVMDTLADRGLVAIVPADESAEVYEITDNGRTMYSLRRERTYLCRELVRIGGKRINYCGSPPAMGKADCPNRDNHIT